MAPFVILHCCYILCRHLAFIVYLVILLLFLLAVFLVVVLAPVCKSGIGVIM